MSEMDNISSKDPTSAPKCTCVGTGGLDLCVKHLPCWSATEAGCCAEADQHLVDQTQSAPPPHGRRSP
jgi:hypothetical protein